MNMREFSEVPNPDAVDALRYALAAFNKPEPQDSFAAKQRAAIERWAEDARKFHQSIAPQNRWALSSADVAFLRACGIQP